MIVLLPGLRGQAEEFEPMHRLLPGARILELPAEPLSSLAEIAARLEGPLHAATLIIGASFGGLVARAAVAAGISHAPLVLIGTLPHPDAPAAARRCGPLGKLLPALPDRVYEALYARRARAEWAADTVSPWPETLPGKHIIGARLRAIAAWGLGPIPPDTRVIWGSKDRFITWSADDVRRWGGRPFVFDAGHRPHLSRPGDVVHILPTLTEPAS